jgi:IclR family transcriptional regulator, KDG regulon repressor
MGLNSQNGAPTESANEAAMPPSLKRRAKAPTPSGAQSVEKALSLLELFTPKRTGLTVGDVAAELKIPKSSVHRLLTVLRQRGYTRQIRAGGPYGLGPRTVALALAYRASEPLSTVAIPHMENLRRKLNETVGLYVRQNGTRVLIERLESSHAMQVTMTPGEPMPLRGAAGRVLAMDGARALATDVVVTRGERVPNSCGIASPIFDHEGQLVAAVDISGPLDRFSPSAVRRYSREVSRTAAAISAALGAPPRRG